MDWTIDPQHEQFKVYRLRLAADKVRKGMNSQIMRLYNIKLYIKLYFY